MAVLSFVKLSEVGLVMRPVLVVTRSVVMESRMHKKPVTMVT